MAELRVGEIENTEHISATDGENINAKRAGVYGYDYAGSQWRRISVDANGQLN